MTNGTDSAAKTLLSVMGVAFLTVAAESFLRDGAGNSRVIGLGGIGVFLLIAAVSFSKISDLIGVRLAVSIGNCASDFRVWLLLLLSVWAYATTESVILLIQRDKLAQVIEQDIIPFRLALERWVIPRHLTPEQIESIGAYLSKFNPQPVTFNILKDDEEAGSYRADIQRALTRGGWTLFQFNYVSEIREGLTTHYTQTTENAQRREDPRSPRPDRLFQDAFRQAGVQINGSSSSGGGNEAQNSFSINIGKRKRDGHASPQQWPFK